MELAVGKAAVRLQSRPVSGCKSARLPSHCLISPTVPYQNTKIPNYTGMPKFRNNKNKTLKITITPVNDPKKGECERQGFTILV